MIVALDNTFLTLLLKPEALPRPSPLTGLPTTYWREKLEGMIDQHSRAGDLILIPAPSLAEALTAVPSIAKAVDFIKNSSAMQVAPFDTKCAIELGLATHAAIKAGDKKGGVQAGWQEVKFDRQIAVIAKTAGASLFYTDDNNQAEFAAQLGLRVVHTWDLTVPSNLSQLSFLDQS